MDYDSAKAYAETLPRVRAVEHADHFLSRASMPTYTELIALLEQVKAINPFGSPANTRVRDWAADALNRIDL